VVAARVHPTTLLLFNCSLLSLTVCSFKFLMDASTEAISFQVSLVLTSTQFNSFLIPSSSFKASFLDWELQLEWWEKGSNILFIFLREPTLAKSVNPVSSKRSKILSTATFVKVETKTFVSVSPISSSNAEINLIIATRRYDFPHPKAPWTSRTFCVQISFEFF
jgi:hypothetical protein